MYPVVHWNVRGFAAAAVIFLFYFFGISACVPPARGSGFIFVIGVLIYHCLWKPEILILKLCLNRVRLILIHFLLLIKSCYAKVFHKIKLFKLIFSGNLRHELSLSLCPL